MINREVGGHVMALKGGGGGGGGVMVKIREKNSSFVNALIVIIIFTSNLIPGLISNVKYKTNHHPPKKRGGIHMISREVGGGMMAGG